jgi:flagellar protein FliO/FliZ
MNATGDLVMLGRVSISLVIVVVLALIVARLARRATVRGPGAGVRVLDRVGLSREASLAVVEVAGSALVLGVTAHSVSLLTTLDPASLSSALTSTSTSTEPAVSVARQRITGTGSVLDPRTWRQAVEALRDRTVRR